MKPFTGIIALSITAALLFGANVFVRQPRAMAPPEPLPAAGETPRPELASPAPAVRDAAPVTGPTMVWMDIETTNYPQYVGNLRSVGFPEELIRCMIKADVDALYAPREARLKPSPIPHDASTRERYQFPTPEVMERMRQLRELAYEKQTVLESLLGAPVPRELIRAPGARNYGAYEYAISQLPLEKQEAVQRIEEQLFYTDDLQRILYPDKREELEAFRQCRKARDDALQKILTPEEWERHHRLTTPCGTELAREVIGMQPTDQEFRVMFELAYQRWQDCGGVYGRSRAVPVPPETITAVHAKYQADLRAALGPDRYLDYQMATSDMGRNLRNFADRYGLYGDTMAQFFQLQQQADALSRSGGAANPAVTEVQTRLQNLLGPSVWLAWFDGRNSRAQLDP